MEKQNLFTEEELAKVTDEAERKHLIECAQDQSKIDMKYMENWKKGRLWKRTITTKPSSAAKHICTWMTYRHRRSCQCQDIQQSRRTTKSESL